MKPSTPFHILASLLVPLLAGLLLATCSLRPAAETPAISLSPAAGRPGSTIRLSGSGFPAGTEVSVRLGPPAVGATPYAYATAVADIPGTFTLLLTLPATWPDGSPITQQELLVVVLNQDGSLQTSAPLAFQPAANLTLTPASGVPGEAFLAAGVGFPAGRSVSLHLASLLEGDDPVPLATVTVGSTGHFTATLRLPERWPSSRIPLAEQALSIVAHDMDRGATVATAPYFNRAGTVEAAFYRPLPAGACRQIQEAMSTTLRVEVDRTTNVAFADVQTGLPGYSCRLVAVLAGSQFSHLTDLAQELSHLFSSRGWSPDVGYAIDSSEGAGFGIRREDALAVVTVTVEPVPGTLCPEEAPRETCQGGPTPLRERYRVVVDLVTLPKNR